MSMELMVMVMKTPVGNPLRKLVLLKLADNASDSGECWPSYNTIAEQCEIAKSTVREHIKALVEIGLVSIKHRIGPQGYKSNIYQLHLCQQAAHPMPTGGTPYAGRRHTLCRQAALEPVIEPVIEPAINHHPPTPQASPPDDPPPTAAGGGDPLLEEEEDYIRLVATPAAETKNKPGAYLASIRQRISQSGLSPGDRLDLEKARRQEQPPPDQPEERPHVSYI